MYAARISTSASHIVHFVLTEGFVIKRKGQQEPLQFDKIKSRISKLTLGLDMNFVDPGMEIVYRSLLYLASDVEIVHATIQLPSNQKT